MGGTASPFFANSWIRPCEWIPPVSSSQFRCVLGERMIASVAVLQRVVALLHAVANLLGRVVPVELVDAAREREADEEREQQEAQHVVDHAAERQLHRAEMRADRAEVDQLQDAEDVGGGEQRFGDQLRVERVPVGTARRRVRLLTSQLRLSLQP